MLFIAMAKRVAWWVLKMVGLGLIYVTIIAEGLRSMNDSLALKLWKIPGFAVLREYEGTYKLDLAPFMAIFIFLGVTYLWEQILMLWLLRQPEDGPWKLNNKELFVFGLGAVLLLADLVLFYRGISATGWSGGGMSFSANVGTAAYLGVLLYFTYVSINLRLDVEAQRKGFA